MKHLFIFVALSCAAIAGAATAMYSRSGSGGTLTAPTVLGQKITATKIVLSGGQIVNMYCPVTFFGAGTYQWNWTCSNGGFTQNGIFMGRVSGTMKLTCSGGGRFSTTTCWHVFTGTSVESGGRTGPFSITAKGGVNNAPGTITYFSGIW